MKPSFQPQWSLLGIDNFSSNRRTRNLKLGSVLRCFNDLAVPQMGNVWYGKQVYLATLGIAVAEESRKVGIKVKNIEVANAIEALASLLTFEYTGWKPDSRLKGINKLRHRSTYFEELRKPSIYVTQPWRMGTVQTLPALGIVQNDTLRFNAFELTDLGNNMVEQFCAEYSLARIDAIDRLVKWIKNRNDIRGDTAEYLRKFLSPIVLLQKKNRHLLYNLILKNGSEKERLRRVSIMTWMNMPYLSEKGHRSWKKKPECICVEHWSDMEMGAIFSQVRNLAIHVLDNIEGYIQSSTTKNMVSCLDASREFIKDLEALKNASHTFLEKKYDPSPDKEASTAPLATKESGKVFQFSACG